MRATQSVARVRRLTWIAVVAAAAALLGGALAGCAAQEGNGGIPVQTVQPPSGTLSPTATVSPTDSGGPSPTATPTSPSPTSTSSPSPSPTATAGEAEGAQIYAANCAGCHGKDGAGGIGPDLRGLTARDEPNIVTQVTNGGGGMPAFKDQLTAAQIEDVAAHIAGLQ